MTRTLWDTLTAFGQWDFSDSLQLRSRIITFSRAIAFSNRARVPVDNIQIIRSRMEALSGPNSDESNRTRLSPQSFENAIQNPTDADSLHFGQLRRHLRLFP